MNEDSVFTTINAGSISALLRDRRVEVLARGTTPQSHEEKERTLAERARSAKRKHGLQYVHPEKGIRRNEKRVLQEVRTKAEATWHESSVYQKMQEGAHLHTAEDWAALEDQAKQAFIDGAERFALFLLRKGGDALKGYKTDEEIAAAVTELFITEFVRAFKQAFAVCSAELAIKYAREAYRYDEDVLQDALRHRSLEHTDYELVIGTVKELTEAKPSKKKGNNAPVLDAVINHRNGLPPLPKRETEKEKLRKAIEEGNGSSDSSEDGDAERDDETSPDGSDKDTPAKPNETPTEKKDPKPTDTEKPENTPPPASPKPKDEETKPDTPKEDTPNEKPEPTKPEGGEDDEPIVPPAQPKPEKPSGTPEEGKGTPPETPKEDKPLEGEVISPGTDIVPYQDHPLTPPGFDHYPLRTYVEMTRRDKRVTSELLEALGYKRLRSAHEFRVALSHYRKRRRVLAREYKVDEFAFAHFAPVAEKVARMMFECSLDNYDIPPHKRLEEFFDVRRYVTANKIPVEIVGNWGKRFNMKVSGILDDAMDGQIYGSNWFSFAKNAHQFAQTTKVLEKYDYDMTSYLRGTKKDKKGNPVKSKWVKKAEFDLEICAEIAVASIFTKIRNWLNEADSDGSGDMDRIFIDIARFGMGLFTKAGVLAVDKSTFDRTANEYIALGLVTKEKSLQIWHNAKEAKGSLMQSISERINDWRSS